jgi:hypothetical protein
MVDATAKRESVRRRRTKLGAAGLRPVQFRVADTRAPGFAEEAKRQGELIGPSSVIRDARKLINANSILSDAR